MLPVKGGIVLVRQARGKNIYHLLPGGGVEAGEDIEAALKREVFEETGLECELVAPLFISDSIDPDGARHMVQLTFLATVTGGELSVDPNDRAILGVEVIDPAALPAIDLRPPMGEALRTASQHSFDVPARYLGALWVDEHDAGNTAIPQVTD
ncbi:MAG TPA: NUDIX hydrolase [Coriobacteriia bacterium]